MARRLSLSIAYHDAGHAVARCYIGLPLTDLCIEGGGVLCDATRALPTGTDQHAAWDHLLYCIAGAVAEARQSHRSLATIALTSARDDYRAAEMTVDWLVNRGFARDRHSAWVRAHAEVAEFLHRRWSAMDVVVKELHSGGRVSAAELARLVPQGRKPFAVERGAASSA